MTIQYDGTDLHGWQVQKNGRTVQGEIQDALQKIFKNQKINLIGSGRTDSGVHALGQIANIKLETDMELTSLLNAINGNLKNNDIIIIDICEAPFKFHSRFSALKREYLYKISTKHSPIERNYYWNVSEKIDFKKLEECANLIIGEHDFSELSKKNDEIDNKICEVYLSEWEFLNDKIYYKIVANRFLHHMVRYLVGTMIEISKNRSFTIDHFNKMINANDREQIFRAPSKGLFLKEVYYA
tara:strand:- start:4558 stop:5280 length:723 start_codon:yes stop_codon:yes gene_type:complete